MNKINRILTQIHELEEELARELETTQIAAALKTIVNSNQNHTFLTHRHCGESRNLAWVKRDSGFRQNDGF